MVIPLLFEDPIFDIKEAKIPIVFLIRNVI